MVALAGSGAAISVGQLRIPIRFYPPRDIEVGSNGISRFVSARIARAVVGNGHTANPGDDAMPRIEVPYLGHRARKDSRQTKRHPADEKHPSGAVFIPDAADTEGGQAINQHEERVRERNRPGGPA